MVQCLCHRQISVLQCHIFAHQTDGNILVGVLLAVYHGSPVAEVGLAVLQTQMVADAVGQTLVLQHHGHLIQGGCCHILDDVLFPHVAEHADLPLHVLRNLQFGTADNHVGLDADGEQLLDGVLGGLGLQLIGAGNVRHQCHVDVHGVASAHFGDELADCLQERCALDVAHCAADLGDDHIGVGLLAHPIDALLDLVGDVGDDLNGAAQIVAAALLVQNRPVYLTGGDVVVDGKTLINESLIVSQIQVSLCAVVGDKDLTVLVGAHGAGIHVDIGIKLLDGDLVATSLEQAAQRSGGDTLTQTGDNASGDKYILWHIDKSSHWRVCVRQTLTVQIPIQFIIPYSTEKSKPYFCEIANLYGR